EYSQQKVVEKSVSSKVLKPKIVQIDAVGSSGFSLLEKAQIPIADTAEDVQAPAEAVAVTKEMIDTNMLCIDLVTTNHDSIELEQQDQTVEAQDPEACRQHLCKRKLKSFLNMLNAKSQESLEVISAPPGLSGIRKARGKKKTYLVSRTLLTRHATRAFKETST
ncbi:hypothetical protein ACH5RR_037168, partial [Cinchona calisaya]